MSPGLCPYTDFQNMAGFVDGLVGKNVLVQLGNIGGPPFVIHFCHLIERPFVSLDNGHTSSSLLCQKLAGQGRRDFPQQRLANGDEKTAPRK